MLYLYKYVYYIIYIYSIPFFSTYYTGLSLFELGVDFAGCSIVQPNLQSCILEYYQHIHTSGQPGGIAVFVFLFFPPLFLQEVRNAYCTGGRGSSAGEEVWQEPTMGVHFWLMCDEL